MDDDLPGGFVAIQKVNGEFIVAFANSQQRRFDAAGAPEFAPLDAESAARWMHGQRKARLRRVTGASNGGKEHENGRADNGEYRQRDGSFWHMRFGLVPFAVGGAQSGTLRQENSS